MQWLASKFSPGTYQVKDDTVWATIHDAPADVVMVKAHPGRGYEVAYWVQDQDVAAYVTGSFWGPLGEEGLYDMAFEVLQQVSVHDAEALAAARKNFDGDTQRFTEVPVTEATPDKALAATFLLAAVPESLSL